MTHDLRPRAEAPLIIATCQTPEGHPTQAEETRHAPTIEGASLSSQSQCIRLDSPLHHAAADDQERTDDDSYAANDKRKPGASAGCRE